MAQAFYNSSALTGPGSAFYSQSSGLLLTQQIGLLSCIAVLLITCWLTTGLRIYVRAVLLHKMGIDDWTMLVTVLLYTAQSVMFCVTAGFMLEDTAAYAAGETPISAKVPNMIIASYCLYSATMVVFKISLGFFFLRIFRSRKIFPWIIVLSMAIPAIFGVVNIIYSTVVPCDLESLFFVDLKWCENMRHSSFIAIAETWTLMNTVSDLLYAGLSIVAIVQLTMPVKQKVIASGLCALGCLGCFASIIRLVLFITTISGYSLLGQGLLEAIWTLIEPGLGIAAASAATLRPLLRKDPSRASEESSSSNGRLTTSAPWPQVAVVAQLNSKVEQRKDVMSTPTGLSTTISGPEDV